jgi:hypothetical protein
MKKKLIMKKKSLLIIPIGMLTFLMIVGCTAEDEGDQAAEEAENVEEGLAEEHNGQAGEKISSSGLQERLDQLVQPLAFLQHRSQKGLALFQDQIVLHQHVAVALNRGQRRPELV